MSLKTYIKRGIQYVLHGIPQKEVKASVFEMAPNTLLSGRTALVTGGTSGIGYEITKAFLKAGANVIITGRNITRIEKTCSKLRTDVHIAEENFLLGIEFDNKNASCFEAKLNEILNLPKVSSIDILVNNAGVMGGFINNTTEDEFSDVIDINLKATFFLSRLFGRYWKNNNIQGNILNIASSSSLRPADSAYSLSKWGVRGLTLGLAKSLSPYGITVNGIAPGPTATSMLLGENTENLYLSKSPIGRYVMPQEIANVAVLLVSNMGKTIVGDIIYMTGGAGIITFDDVKYSF